MLYLLVKIQGLFSLNLNLKNGGNTAAGGLRCEYLFEAVVCAEELEGVVTKNIVVHFIKCFEVVCGLAFRIGSTSAST